MKTKLAIKLLVVTSLCLAALLLFTACKDDEIYAGSEDFQSYPEYWNDFNNNTGDIYIPDTNSTTSGNSKPDENGSNDSSNTSSDVSSDDFTANFIEDDEEEESKPTSSEKVDTDKDGTPDVEDPDDDNDDIPDDKDPDDDNDGIPDEEEKIDYGNQGPLVYF